MTECSNGLKILTTLLIAICMEFTEEYDKVLKWSQNTHSSTHSYIYGMTRFSNGLKILTTLSYVYGWNPSEQYDKVLKWSQNNHNSTHSYMYGIHRKIWQGAQMVSKYSQLYSPLYTRNSPKNMTRCSNGLKILTTPLIAIWMEFIRRTWQGGQMVSKFSQLYSPLHKRNSPKNMTRC